MFKYIIILLTLFLALLLADNNNTFIGKYSNHWSNKLNWSLNRCPIKNDTVYINNNYVFLEVPTYIHINNLLLLNSKLFIDNTYMNISNYLDNNGILIISNSTVYIWNISNNINTGQLYLYNSNFIPNGNLIVNKYTLLSGLVLIPTNIYINSVVEFLPNTSLLMAYTFNITQSINSKIIVYGFPYKKEYLQQYIFMCYQANMKGVLEIKFDGRVGYNQTTWWFLIMPAIMNGNTYNFRISSDHYNVTLKKMIDDSLIIQLIDKN